MAKIQAINAAGWLALLALLPCGCEKTARRTTTAPAGTTASADYVSALAAANHFCQAWQEEDFATGKTLLTARLIERHGEAKLVDAISGTGNPRHVAYEIVGGRSLESGGFEFNVRLYRQYHGRTENRVEVVQEHLVLVRDSGGYWLVDDLPFPPGGVSLGPAGAGGGT